MKRRKRRQQVVMPAPALPASILPDAAMQASRFPQCALALTRRTARTLTQLYDSHLVPSGMEATQFALLMTLETVPGRSQVELGRIMGMDKTTLSRNMKVLLVKGWVEVVTAQDARQRRMALSAEGRRRMMAAKPAWRRAQEALQAHMRAAEWDVMWGAMQAVTRAATEALQSE